MSKIIVISGKSGHGKDEAAKHIVEKLTEQGLKCITLHFADLVKFFCTQVYGWNGEKDIKGRTLLQHVGTDTVRACYPDYWAEVVSKFLAATAADYDVALVPDARFPNEIEVMDRHNNNVIVLRVKRYNQDGSKYLNPKMTDLQHKHPSETSLDFSKFDCVIENHSLEDFHHRLDEFLEDIDFS